MESILDFDSPTQTQATRTFLINQMEIFGAPAEKIKKLEDKNGVRYDGFFKQGKKHGAFVETDKNGNVIRKGVYKFGTLDAEQK